VLSSANIASTGNKEKSRKVRRLSAKRFSSTVVNKHRSVYRTPQLLG
jgi:hypothetical protein